MSTMSDRWERDRRGSRSPSRDESRHPLEREWDRGKRAPRSRSRSRSRSWSRSRSRSRSPRYRHDSPGRHGRHRESNNRIEPTNVLMLRGLDRFTTSDQIINVIRDRDNNAVVTNVRIIMSKTYPNENRGFGFVEFETVAMADVFLQRTRGELRIDGARVTLEFSNEKKKDNDWKCYFCGERNFLRRDTCHRCRTGKEAATDPSLKANPPYLQAKARLSDTIPAIGVVGVPAAPIVMLTSDGTCPAPDIRDAPGGFKYEVVTGYYYDPNSRYFYDSQTGVYKYYDAVSRKYISVDQEGKPMGSAASGSTTDNAEKQAVHTGTTANPSVSGQPPPKKKKKSSKSGVIQSGVIQIPEAILLKKPKSPAPSAVNTVPEKPQDAHQGIQQSNAHAVSVSEEDPIDPAFSSFDESAEIDAQLRLELTEQIHLELVKWPDLICGLCNRKFKNEATLGKHVDMSDLHKANLETQIKDLAEQQHHNYANRAKQRRTLFHQPDNPIDAMPLRGKLKEYSQPNRDGISSDNKGSQLLKKMGWQEGTGLGAQRQGIAVPIQATMHAKGAGLGSAGGGFTPTTGNAMRDTMMNHAKIRYNQA